jgi:hypothetical protein
MTLIETEVKSLVEDGNYIKIGLSTKRQSQMLTLPFPRLLK